MPTPRLPPLVRAVLPRLQGPARLMLILAAHGLLLGWALQAVPRLQAPQQPEVQAIEVRTIQAPTPLPQLAPPPPLVRKTTPTPKAPMPQRQAPSPEPILTATSAASTADSTPAPSPAPAPLAAASSEAPPAPEAPRPAPITPARFDADYLQNPEPAYPILSRRQGEQGRVLLAVRVSAEGRADEVQVKQTSGHSRLDEAARAAVRQWRFVPARQGSEAVAANVVVPITFRLNS